MSDLIDLIDVYTTTATRADAEAIGRALVERRLVACAQVSAIDSIYRWEGAVQQEAEFRLVLKTTVERWPQVEAAIRELHPYALPAIHAVAVRYAEEGFAAWVRGEVGR